MADQSAKLLEICLENPLLQNLVKALAEELKTSSNDEDDWITAGEAMTILQISSATTLKKYREQNEIKYSKPSGMKRIFYSRSSILKFLEKKSNH
ncbi:MAG: helix-turn-helix domain-containing protein [Bacteroidota bacterium]